MKTISGAVEGDQLRTSEDGETGGGGEAAGGRRRRNNGES